jgi:hypothetical protein
MQNRLLRSAVIAAVILLVPGARPSAAQFAFESSASVACAGVNGSCQLVDMFFALQPSPAFDWLPLHEFFYFDIYLLSPAWLFATMVEPGEWDRGDGVGEYHWFLSDDDRYLIAPIGFLWLRGDSDPALRFRVVFDDFADARSLSFGYSFRDNEFNEIAAGEFHSTTTPEPVTLGLLAMGLAGVATARRRRRRNG